MSVVTESINYSAIKRRQQAVWASGNYAVIGNTLQWVGESLAEAADIRAGDRVLDVAAGTGNVSLAAARRYAEVTSTDYVPALLDHARRRADAEGFPVSFEEADAERLPYADASFDVVGSTFGVMFTPDQDKAARELMRVTRSGGRIALANWTPEGFIGRLFAVIGRHVPPPPGVAPPSRWGTRDFIEAAFRHQASISHWRVQPFMFRYRSAAHWLDTFRTWYGPTHRAFASLDEAGASALADDILALLTHFNVGGETSLVVPSDYVELVATRS